MEEKRVTYTLKQEKAIQHYLINGDKTKAYRHAYNCSRMKDSTVNRKAKELFDNGKITARIEFEREKIYERNKATIDEALSILSDNLRTDPAEMFYDDGKLKKLKEK